MKILIYTWFGSYTDGDIEIHLKGLGHNCKRIEDLTLLSSNQKKNEIFCEKFSDELKSNKYDCVFTTNFQSLIAKVCYEKNIPYISWSYDSPPNIPNTEHMDHPTNHLFFFSMDDVDDLASTGLSTVHYMPLAVDVNKWDLVKVSDSSIRKYSADVSLVGSLYDSTLPALMQMMDEEQRLFFKTLSDIQLKSYEKYVLKEFITEGIAAEVSNSICKNNPNGVRPTAKQLIYATATYVTHLDRMMLLRMLSREYQTHLYTQNRSEENEKILSDVVFHGAVDYDSEMPLVFKNSKINLCPTFRGNVSGIPLRILDVMGCSAFVLTPYRSGIEEFFVESEDVVTYQSMEEALDKTRYYMMHDDERRRVAANGYKKVKRAFTYSDRLKRMLEYI